MILVPLSPRLRELCSALCDGVISDVDFAELQTCLKDPDTLRSYVRYSQLHGSLLASAPAANDDVFQLLKQFQPTVDVTPAEPAKPRSPVLGFFSNVAQGMMRSPVMTTLLVASLIYGVFGFLAWDLHPNQRVGKNDENDTVVATITDVSDASWSKESQSQSKSDAISSGDSFTLNSGLAELELNRGAVVLLEGPAQWSIDGNNSVTLRQGKLLANVPPSAIGFTVTTPSATIVDLGTEFGVEVRASGATDVQVVKGKIQLHPGAKSSDSPPASQPLTLSAGSAVRVEPAQRGSAAVVQEIPAASDRFTKRDAHLSRRLYVSGALASSTFSEDLNVNNLVNGNGLIGESHSATPKDTMWHAAPGKIKGEYILFDFVRPYRLESIKVWNYNDPHSDRTHSRGVKRADVYISKTGKGSPLDDAGDWQRVAADVSFGPADGTPEYAAPTVVPLDNVETRFAAMVIQESLGHDPSTELDGVGLSEVQFFGVRQNPIQKK